MKNNYTFLPARDRFSPEEFLTPPADCSPIYTWCWHAAVSHEETDRQLDEMQRMGIRAFYILPEPKLFRPRSMLTMMEPEYLTDAFFDEVRYALTRAKERGMRAWLYDEGGWPSGGACGKVLTKHPEYARQTLRARDVTAVGTYKKTTDVLGAFIGTEPVADGTKFPSDTVVTEYFIHTSLFEGGNTADFPDITRREATEAFIEMTHMGYESHMSDLFGDNVFAMFTDEPTAPRPLFRADLAAEFEERNGYSILPFLPYLAGKAEAEGAAKDALCRWYDLLSEKFCENFMLPCKEWSNRNGLAFTGHMDIDHIPKDSVRGGNFHLLRALRCFDVPGVDVIWRQIFPAEASGRDDQGGLRNHFFPRFASTAAAQIGGRHAVTESFCVFGAGLTAEQMRWALSFQAVRGVNIYNFMVFPYAREGWLMTGSLPFFTERHGWFKHMAEFNRHVSRLSYVASLGDAVNETALYFPMEDFWCGGRTAGAAADAFDAAGFALEAAHVPFDLIDDDLLRAIPAGGTIKSGRACYKTVVVPACGRMPADVRAKLDACRAAGLCVITADEIGTLAPAVKFVGEAEGIRVQLRRFDGGRLVLVSNENFTESRAAIDCEGHTYRRLSLEDGEIFAFDGTLTLAAGELAALIETDAPIAAREVPVYEHEREITGFTMRRAERFVVGETRYEKEIFDEAAKPAVLGDWRDVVGNGFTGTCVYEAKFDAPGSTFTLDLGDVRYAAEVFVDGAPIGVRVMPPYRFEVTAAAGEHTLAVHVTNTAGNEYGSTKSLTKWQSWQTGPYPEKTKHFDPDTFASGLIGPVKVRF